MKKKVCKKCKLFVKESVCPICNSSDFSENWNGRIFILNAEKSEIAKRVGIKNNGEYAVKVR